MAYTMRSKCLPFYCFRMCVKVLGNDTSLWEDEVYNFAKNHQLRVSAVALCFVLFFIYFKLLNK